jgi:hypothetical protein
MHARAFLMQLEWIAVFTMYFASTSAELDCSLILICFCSFIDVSSHFCIVSMVRPFICPVGFARCCSPFPLRSSTLCLLLSGQLLLRLQFFVIFSIFFSKDDAQIFLMFVSYLDARMNSSFMRFLHRALCICAMLYLMLRRIIGT